MMGTLATLMAGKKIPTWEKYYWAEVEGDIEDINGVLRITEIRVGYHLRVEPAKVADAREAFSSYLMTCPAAQSVIGCIKIRDNLLIEGMAS